MLYEFIEWKVLIVLMMVHITGSNCQIVTAMLLGVCVLPAVICVAVACPATSSVQKRHVPRFPQDDNAKLKWCQTVRILWWWQWKSRCIHRRGDQPVHQRSKSGPCCSTEACYYFRQPITDHSVICSLADFFVQNYLCIEIVEANYIVSLVSAS